MHVLAHTCYRAGLPRSHIYLQILTKHKMLSHKKRAGPANRDLALSKQDPGKAG